jgi:hypothetical protein
VLVLLLVTLVPREQIAIAVMQVLAWVLLLLLMPSDCRQKHLQP